MPKTNPFKKKEDFLSKTTRLQIRSLFRKSLSQFKDTCLVTKLDSRTLGWSFYRECTMQQAPLINGVEKLEPPSTIIDPSYLTNVVSSMMFAYGDDLYPSQNAINLVLKNTISTILLYCNSMYSSAKLDNRSSINHLDFINLVTRTPTCFHRFMSYALENDDHQMFVNTTYCRPAPIQAVRNLYDSDEYFREFCDTPVIDDHFTDIAARFKHSYLKWDTKTRELWTSQRQISFCCPTDHLSPSYIFRFHQTLGCPPLETDLIYYLDFLAREYIMEIVHRALKIRDDENFSGKIDKGDDYKKALKLECILRVDPLFRLPYHIPSSVTTQTRKRPSEDNLDHLIYQIFRIMQNRARIDEIRRLCLTECHLTPLEEIRRDWWKKHHDPPKQRPTYNQKIWFEMRKR